MSWIFKYQNNKQTKTSTSNRSNDSPPEKGKLTKVEKTNDEKSFSQVLERTVQATVECLAEFKHLLAQQPRLDDKFLKGYFYYFIL